MIIENLETLFSNYLARHFVVVIATSHFFKVFPIIITLLSYNFFSFLDKVLMKGIYRIFISINNSSISNKPFLIRILDNIIIC